MSLRPPVLAIVLVLAALMLASPAVAQEKQHPCGVGFVDNRPLLHRAAFKPTDVTQPAVALTFVGHATFEITSPAGITVVTDYNNNYRADRVPDIATMNINRGNHSSYDVPASVRYVLHGWDEGKGIPHYDVHVGDVRVFNVPTNVVNLGQGATNDSSIFVIQMSGLCIAHLGHMRHVIDDERVRHMGRIDVLLMPVDGQVTESRDELLFNLGKIKPRIVIPMHFFSLGMAESFVASVADLYPVKKLGTNTLRLTRAELPAETEVWLMRPTVGYYSGGGGQF